MANSIWHMAVCTTFIINPIIMFRFETLDIWKLSLEYCNDCYDLAKTFPQYELFALSDQLRRAAISGPNNIVEGSGSDSDKLYCRYLNIAINSIYETVNILIFAEMRGYILEKEKNKMYETAEVLIRKIKPLKSHYLNTHKPKAICH